MRPPTRAEVWAYVSHYFRGVKTHEECVAYAIHVFVGTYVYNVNVYGWALPPDCSEGEPVVREACPPRPLEHLPGPGGFIRDTVSHLLVRAGKRPLPPITRLEEAA